LNFCPGSPPLGAHQLTNILAEQDRVTHDLGTMLSSHMERLYLVFAREVYAAAAGPANNLQSLYSMYAQHVGQPGVSLDDLHQVVVHFVGAVYRPTLSGLVRSLDKAPPSVQAEVGWRWFPLPFFAKLRGAVDEHLGRVASSHAPGNFLLSEQCVR
jgi:hypothetical protein